MASKAQATGLIEAVDRAVQIAREYPHAAVEPIHLLKAVLAPEGGPASRITELGHLNYHEILAKVDKALDELPVAPHSREAPLHSPALRSVLQQASAEAETLGDDKTDEIHVLLAIASPDGGLTREFRTSLGYRKVALLDAIRKWRLAIAVGGDGIPGGSTGAGSLSATVEFCDDLTGRAERGELDPVVGREVEIAKLVEALARRRKSNAMLIGDPGTGKSAIVEGLAQLLARGNVPDHLKGARVYALDLPGMVAGAKYKGEFEERFKKLLTEFAKRENAILFIDEVHTILGIGRGGGGVDAANMLKPILARGEIKMVGVTTHAEYKEYIEKDRAFVRRFVEIPVVEPTDAETLEILRGLAPAYERHHGVRFDGEALESAVKLSRRYITTRQLPDKAVDLLDESAADVRILSQLAKRLLEASEADREAAAAAFRDGIRARRMQIPPDFDSLRELAKAQAGVLVDAEAMARRVAIATGIPVQKMTSSERDRILHLEDHLHKRVIGQDAAIQAVSKAIRRSRAGLKLRPGQPVGSFLFLGPTGTGKTELAKALAEFLFDDENAMVRIDMTEYTGHESLKRLVGADPGFVGYEEGGSLTEAIKKRPYSVVLFDEIDKAHPRCLDILIPLLDDGRLTDGKSQTIDCSNTVVILTSNYAGPWIARQFWEAGGVDRDELRRRLVTPGDGQRPDERGFRPELLNRFDDFQVFHPLAEQHVRAIVDLQVRRLTRLLAEQNVVLEVSPEALDAIAREGYDPEMGGRPIRRAIDRKIGDPLSVALVAGESEGAKRVRVSVVNGEIDVRIESQAEAAA